MANTLTDYSCLTTWTDVVATDSSLASAEAFIQNKGPAEVLIVFSTSSTAPNGFYGQVLRPGFTVTGTAAHIWVVGLGLGATLAVGTADAGGGGGSSSVSLLQNGSPVSSTNPLPVGVYGAGAAQTLTLTSGTLSTITALSGHGNAQIAISGMANDSVTVTQGQTSAGLGTAALIQNTTVNSSGVLSGSSGNGTWDLITFGGVLGILWTAGSTPDNPAPVVTIRGYN